MALNKLSTEQPKNTAPGHGLLMAEPAHAVLHLKARSAFPKAHQQPTQQNPRAQCNVSHQSESNDHETSRQENPSYKSKKFNRKYSSHSLTSSLASYVATTHRERWCPGWTHAMASTSALGSSVRACGKATRGSVEPGSPGSLTWCGDGGREAAAGSSGSSLRRRGPGRWKRQP